MRNKVTFWLREAKPEQLQQVVKELDNETNIMLRDILIDRCVEQGFSVPFDSDFVCGHIDGLFEECYCPNCDNEDNEVPKTIEELNCVTCEGRVEAYG